MECWENIIGINDDCTTNTYKYVLDDYGFSLYNAAKMADERFKTGKALLQSIIRRAWDDVYNDVTFEGFDTNKIALDAEIGLPDCDQEVTGGTGSFTVKTGKKGKLSELFLPYILLNVKTAGTTTVTLERETPTGTVTETLYSGAVTAGIKRIAIDKWCGQQYTISIDLTDVVMCKTIKNYGCACSCESYTITGDLAGITIGLQIRCNKSTWLCKYNDALAPLALHRTLALVWMEVKNSNRFSEFKQFKQEEAGARAIYHDSSFPLYVDGDIKWSPEPGQYQILRKKLSLPRPTCGCCVQCRGGAQIVTAIN